MLNQLVASALMFQTPIRGCFTFNMSDNSVNCYTAGGRLAYSLRSSMDAEYLVKNYSSFGEALDKRKVGL